jgi:hypothetical protein
MHKLFPLFLLGLLPAMGWAQSAATEKKSTHYIEPGTYGTKRENDPPNYVRNLAKTGISGTENTNWLNVGLDYRIRYEHRHHDIRRVELTDDNPYLLRTRAYIGITQKLDPFRAVVEFEDARRVNSIFAEDTRDFNRNEIIQAYGELHFKKALGQDDLGNNRPAFVRYGRMAFEFLDRRLLGLNQWRNTTNNFNGLRASIGQDANPWALDLLALNPIGRVTNAPDTTDTDRTLLAAIGHWRKWSKVVTIEPHFLVLNQRATPATLNRARQINTLGLRLYGWVGKTGVNYDVTGMAQFGEDNQLQHRAQSFTGEVGYKMAHAWKPRVSFFLGYASGDKDPNDNQNNRFERYFGFARPWSADDYIVMENVVARKFQLEFEPVKNVRVDAGYSLYALASATDRFNNLLAGANNRDNTGQSGRGIGNSLDTRVRLKPTKFTDLTLGYSHFTNGDFVLARQEATLGESADGSTFFYIEFSANAFDLFKK